MEKEDNQGFTTEEFTRFLRAVKEDFPILGTILLTAAENRVKILSCHCGDAINNRIRGPYLSGLEELFGYLDVIYSSFKNQQLLGRIAFLVKRVRADFEIAFDAVLSGLNSVVMDHMRDLMELEFLLRDFTYDPQHIDIWLNCDSRERYKRFSPKKLRERHAKQLRMKPENLPDEHNYKLHSEMLHVTPFNAVDDFAPKGFTQVSRLEGAEFGFWEIFEHAHRLVFTLHRLGVAVAGPDWTTPDPMTELPNLRESYHRTKAVLALFVKDGQFQKTETENTSQ